MFVTVQIERRLAILLVAAMALGISGCAGAASNSDSSNVTVSMPSMESQQPVSLADPAFFYGGPGITVTNSVYEGLVRYQPNGAESDIEGAVAEKWKVSPDGKTYTFILRDAKFPDGTSVTPADVEFSFSRFTGLAGGPSYMLEGVARYETPDASTFAIKLDAPKPALLDYLASPYGPKVLQKTLVEENAGDDQGQTWLATHSAGSGPYAIASWKPNQQYVLEANKNYWGGEPEVETLIINASDDASGQMIDLRQGKVDAIRLNQPSDLEVASGLENVEVVYAPSLLVQVLAIDPTLPPFNRPEVRDALRAALDKPALVDAVWADLGAPSEELMPPGLMDPSQDPDVTELDPAQLKSAVASLPASERKITFYYTTQSSDERMAQAIGAVLEDAGFEVTLRLPSNGVEWWKTDKVNLYVQTTNPDAAHPDAWMQIFYKTTGFLNFLHGGSKQIDDLIDTASRSADDAAATAAYARAAAAVYEDASFITLAAVKNAWALNADIRGASTNPSAAFAIDFSDARRE